MWSNLIWTAKTVIKLDQQKNEWIKCLFEERPLKPFYSKWIIQ